jgi:hypothetical protein
MLIFRPRTYSIQEKKAKPSHDTVPFLQQASTTNHRKKRVRWRSLLPRRLKEEAESSYTLCQNFAQRKMCTECAVGWYKKAFYCGPDQWIRIL